MALDHVLEIIDGAVPVIQLGRIVELVRVGQVSQFAFAGIHQVGLVIVDPVRHVIHTRFGQHFERVPGLGQTGAKPAARALATEFLQFVQRLRDDLALLLWGQSGQPHAVGQVVPHQFPIELEGILEDLRMVVTNVGVDGGRCPHAIFFEHVHHTEDADTVAVIALAPWADGRCFSRWFFPGMTGDGAFE